MSTITLKKDEWQTIREKIEQRHGKNIFLISWRLKRELGFTVRVHQEWIIDEPTCTDRPLYGKKETIRLDFYDGSAETIFRLTYL